LVMQLGRMVDGAVGWDTGEYCNVILQAFSMIA